MEKGNKEDAGSGLQRSTGGYKISAIWQGIELE